MSGGARSGQVTGCGAGWGPGTTAEVRGTAVRLEAGSSAAFGIRVGAVHALGGGSAASGVAAALREGLRSAAEQVPGAELVPGLAVGDTTLITSKTDEQMREASLTHLVAVSGANCE